MTRADISRFGLTYFTLPSLIWFDAEKFTIQTFKHLNDLTKRKKSKKSDFVEPKELARV